MLFCLDFAASSSCKKIFAITTNTKWKYWSANRAHDCIRWPIASLWYICIFAALNASKYVIIIEVTKTVLLKSHNSSSFSCRWCNNDVNLSPAVALERSRIHQPTISLDKMDLVCHSPPTVNPDAFNPLICTLYLSLYFYIFLTMRSLHLQDLCLHNRQLRVSWFYI